MLVDSSKMNMNVPIRANFFVIHCTKLDFQNYLMEGTSGLDYLQTHIPVIMFYKGNYPVIWDLNLMIQTPVQMLLENLGDLRKEVNCIICLLLLNFILYSLVS